ncbi:MAG: KEOPS complex subunit Cgi121 [Promethearchaeota archaeon]
MILREFYIEEMELRYFVGINQLKFDTNQFFKNKEIVSEEEVLNYIFKTIEELQDKNKESVVQIINDKYVLSEDHIFTACYYMQKAFFHKTYISNKKNIELLLYLSTHRQISKGLESFGINFHDLKEGNIIACIISPIDNIKKLNKDILQNLNATEIELKLNNLSNDKIKRIIDNYEISDSQIKTVLNSYINEEKNITELNKEIKIVSLAVFDLICEKMALLNLEKIKSN